MNESNECIEIRMLPVAMLQQLYQEECTCECDEGFSGWCGDLAAWLFTKLGSLTRCCLRRFCNPFSPYTERRIALSFEAGILAQGVIPRTLLGALCEYLAGTGDQDADAEPEGPV
jgi:hypothetical protein